MMTPETNPDKKQAVDNESASFGSAARDAAASERAKSGPPKIATDRLANNLVTVVDTIVASRDTANVVERKLELDTQKTPGQWREGSLTLASPAETEYKGAPLVAGKLSLTMDGNNVARFRGGAQNVPTSEKTQVDLHFVLPPGSDAKQFADTVEKLFARKENGVDTSKAQTISSSAVVDFVLSSTELVNLGGKSFRIGSDGHRPLPLARMSIGNQSGAPLENVIIDNVELRDVRFHGKMKNVTMSRTSGAGITFARVDAQSGVTFNGQKMQDGIVEIRNGTVLLNQVLLPGSAVTKGEKTSAPSKSQAAEKAKPVETKQPERFRGGTKSHHAAETGAARNGGDRSGPERTERFRGDPAKTAPQSKPQRKPTVIPYRQERDRSTDYVVYDQEIKAFTDGILKDKAPLIGQFKKMTISVSEDNQSATIDLVMEGSNFSPRGLFAKHARKDAHIKVDIELKGFRDSAQIEAMFVKMATHFQSGRDGVIEGKSITTAKLLRELFLHEEVKITGMSGENFYLAAHQPLKGRKTDISSPTGLLNLNGAVLGGASSGLRNVVIDSANLDRAHILGKLENVHIVKSSLRLARFDNVTAVRGTTINDNDLFGARATGKFDLRDFNGNHTGKAELPSDMKVKLRDNEEAKSSIWRQLAALDKEGRDMLAKAVGLAFNRLKKGPRNPEGPSAS